ncbi:RHS repeat domain-containing protein [Massilia frigida]|uniref:RHS repeat domain-containing protein n=1 Tax=Massilia frigida TaxID=2609281 RepID=UPI00141DC10B|nr:RHS repeat protein [Massilia frigida]
MSVTERSGLKQVFTYSDGVSNNTSVSHFPAAAPACANVHPDDVLPAGRLLCVTNNWGRQLQFMYDVKGRIAEMIDPAGKSTLYEYDGASGGCIPGNEASVSCKANNLTKVTYPDGKSQTYWYNEASRIQINDDTECKFLTKTTGNGFGPTAFRNLMTGLVDENEDRHISWTYNCAGRATSSQLGEDIDKVTVAYVAKPDTGGPPLAIVTHYVGPKEKPVTSVSYFEKDYVQGVAKTTNIYAPCVECGSIAQRKYDAIGNVSMTKDFNGNYSCFQYEAGRNLETARVEGATTGDCPSLLAAQTLALPLRKTTTKWHAQFRLPETIAEPKRITKYQYDVKTGNVLIRTEQATTDLTGAQGVNAPLTGSVRKWAYTYIKGQLETVTGPRTDIVDLTKYEYDPLTGYLVKVTNAAKQETTYGDHDAHGRVHTIRAPNGVTTKLGYTERGWLESHAVSDGTTTHMTTYAYKPSGQVEMVTFPDKSVTKYTYDVAHRLTSVVSDRDESIIYTLDLTGNRIKEEVRDPNGNLVRQITRTYDKTGRLTSQTGAAR